MDGFIQSFIHSFLHLFCWSQLCPFHRWGETSQLHRRCCVSLPASLTPKRAVFFIRGATMTHTHTHTLYLNPRSVFSPSCGLVTRCCSADKAPPCLRARHPYLPPPPTPPLSPRAGVRSCDLWALTRFQCKEQVINFYSRYSLGNLLLSWPMSRPLSPWPEIWSAAGSWLTRNGEIFYFYF